MLRRRRLRERTHRLDTAFDRSNASREPCRAGTAPRSASGRSRVTAKRQSKASANDPAVRTTLLDCRVPYQYQKNYWVTDLKTAFPKPFGPVQSNSPPPARFHGPHSPLVRTHRSRLLGMSKSSNPELPQAGRSHDRAPESVGGWITGRMVAAKTPRECHHR